MMLDPRNAVVMTCGVVADPEVISGNMAKLRVAVDYAGYEKGSDNRSGYFDVVFYLDDSNPNAKFVKSQIEDSKMKKGSQIQLIGTLKHRRWETEDGGKRSAVSIQAENIAYVRGGGDSKTGSSPTSSSESSEATLEVPDEF